MSGKRSAEQGGLEQELEQELEEELEQELDRLCGPGKCEVCFVPIGSAEVASRHYGGKIHGKKVSRWREQWLAQKKIKLETELPSGSVSSTESNGSGLQYNAEDKAVTAPEQVKIEIEKEVPVKRLGSNLPCSLTKLIRKSESL